jgi:ferric-dicitrate binding protein FerR (iron transport regulator)
MQATEAQRAAAIEAIASALNAKTRRRTRRTWAFGLSAAAALAVASYAGVRAASHPALIASTQPVSAVASPSGSGTAILRGSRAEPLVGVASLGQGGQLVAGNSGGATIHLSTGTELSIAHDTRVSLESVGASERFFLAEGVLDAKVAKLGASERFVVRTPDTEVEVRGTQFRVAIVEPDINCGNGARTRVSVSEGLVEVRGAGATSYVHPGESWPAGCAVSPAANPERVAQSISSARKLSAHGEPQRAVMERAAASDPSTARDSAVQPQSGAKEASSIAQQNELFSEAAAARRAGDSARAASAYELLMARYPASPLAESAAVQRMNLLGTSDPVSAKVAARQYLARYPQGYARNEAEALLARP